MLVYLRGLDTKIDGLIADVRDLKHWITAVEIQLGQFTATESSHHASTASRLDRIEVRLDRLERQADILPA